MSDLAKSLKRAQRANLPPEPALIEEDQQQQEDDSSSASSMSSTGTVVPSSNQKPASPVAWTEFFAQELYLETELGEGSHAKYHVYLTPPATPKTPVIVLHHGAGSSAMTFALFAQEVRRLMPEVGLLAVEAREHGSVVYTASGAVDNDMSIKKLRQDFLNMIHLTKGRMGWTSLPQMVLVGHSLGGAVVTDLAKSGELASHTIGYAVLDVVEGSAMDALKHMQSYLASRPATFPSLASGIEWHIRSRTLRNPKSARASVPSLLMPTDKGNWAWKTDLTRTEAYWSNWFDGMSSKFLTGSGAKLLLLAGTDRLDKELMIGQMQGKFQLQVFPAAGHFLQEDLPDQVAHSIVEFLKRNDRATLVLPPKVSDLLAQGKKI
ncbi:protein phosphatase methylesteras-like protein 1 [Saccharata proteae CBS 121410]|uniref:Protein phosphatase methylesterase 1 n=1 Tax=Saccharata proteae CBS 121410 TaxID=1314787 RepID=A0A9P4HXK4_9PEZI|nr:protein phosphatase methylesteras-like protein 1 [Saccharata proteae CBS 121410]